MIFNSLVFIVFLIVVLVLYNVPRSWRARKLILLLASIFFYGSWRPEYLILILVSTLVDWFLGRALGEAKGPKRRRFLLMMSLCSNLGLLAFFKYGNFFVDNLNLFLSLNLIESKPIGRFDVLLPVGISFYTFQTLSYTIDIYRGQMRPWRSFLDFALFVTFFPQLVAGPIVRAVDFEPQCEQATQRSLRAWGWGACLLLLGLFQKIVLSDALLAPQVDAVYQGSAAPGLFDAWVSTLAFSGQIYFDFAGYSFCAIGLAMMLGFSLPDNFHSPYAALGFSDFWRRWHISLSTWLRDYLYIALGGNRRGALRTSFNLFMTMLLGGLWHGASWNFVLWGALHGSYLIVERKLRPTLSRVRWLQGRAGAALGWIVTYLLVCVAWIPFRALEIGHAWSIFRGALGLNVGSALVDRKHGLLALGVVVGMLAIQRAGRDHKLESLVERLPWVLTALLLGMMLFLTLTNIGMNRAFIYFQF